MGELHALEDLEINLLLEGVYHCFELDLRGYGRARLKSKLRDLMQAQGVKTVSGLQEQVMHDARALEAFVRALGE
jgi:chemotaxis protein methyltransferase CheR